VIKGLIVTRAKRTAASNKLGGGFGYPDLNRVACVLS